MQAREELGCAARGVLIQKFRILQVFLVFSLMRNIVYRHKAKSPVKF